MSMKEPFRVGEVITYYEKEIPGVVTAVEWREAARDFYYKVQSLEHPEAMELGWLSVKDDRLRKAGKDLALEFVRIVRNKHRRTSAGKYTAGIVKAEYIIKKVIEKIEHFSLDAPVDDDSIFEIGGQIIEAYESTGRGATASIYARVFAATAPAQKGWLANTNESASDWTSPVQYLGEATLRAVDEIRIKTVLLAIDNALESFPYRCLLNFVIQIAWIAGKQARDATYDVYDLLCYWDNLSEAQKVRAIADYSHAREKLDDAPNTPTSKQAPSRQTER